MSGDRKSLTGGRGVNLNGQIRNSETGENNIMLKNRTLAFAACAAFGWLSIAGAAAQNYGGSGYAPPQPAPLYPYATNSAVQQDHDRYQRSGQRHKIRRVQEDAAPRADRRVRKSSQHALIEKRRVIDVDTGKRRITELPPEQPPRRKRAGTAADSNVRVIHAEAEVRIMGRDQMSIKLYRKGGKPPAD